MERTALAWNRSGLAIAAIAASIAKAGAEADHPRIGAVAAAALLLMAVGVWAFGNLMYADRRRKRPLDPRRQRLALRLICAVSVVSAAIAFAFALLG